MKKKKKKEILLYGAIGMALLLSLSVPSQSRNRSQSPLSPLKDLQDNSQQLRIEEEMILGKEYGAESDMFSYIRDISFDRNDALYVMDSMELHIKVFNQEGGYVRTFGRKGQGPGEFQSLDGISWNPTNGFLYIADRRNHRISWFTPDGKFVDAIKTSVFKADIENLCCLSEGRFALNARITGDRTSTYKIIVTDSTFKKILAEIEEDFPVYAVGAEISPGFADVGCLKKDILYYTSPSSYEISILDSDFQKATTIKRPVPPMFPPHYVKGFYVDFNAIESLLPIEGGFVVGVKSTQIKNVPKFKEKRELIEFVYKKPDFNEWKLQTAYQIDVYDDTFRFLTSVAIPVKRHLAGQDSQGRLYFIENDPFPRIIRCRLIIDRMD